MEPDGSLKRFKPDEQDQNGLLLDQASPENKTETKGKKKNTGVYVTGLPSDITIDELQLYFGRVGVIMDDMFTGGPRIKLYVDEEGVAKGDALIVYLRPESVQLAIDLLDESQIRPQVTIRVAVAESGGKGSEEAKTTGEGKPPAVDKETWIKHMRAMQRKLQWGYGEDDSPPEAEEDEAKRQKKSQADRIVLLEGMYTVEELEGDAQLELDLKEDVMEEAERCGPFHSISLLSHLDPPLVAIKFHTAQAATACLALMDGRWYAGRTIKARRHDGSFRIRKKRGKKRKASEGDDEEADGVDNEEAERLDRFGRWLEGDEAGDEDDEASE